MKELNLEKLFACPRCNHTLTLTGSIGKCKECKFAWKKLDGIWHFLYIPQEESRVSLKKYDAMHKGKFGGHSDGSYEILASIARGNKTVDIACGEGLIEKLSPETVGVEFSLNALKKAKKNGAKHLVLADAHALPFVNDAFDISLSLGNLEHFTNPQIAINEMARVSTIQVLMVHQYPPIPFASVAHHLATKLFHIKHQPIEEPINFNRLAKMIKTAGLRIIFKGVWTLPFNYGRVIKFLPEFKNVPSVSFIISTKK